MTITMTLLVGYILYKKDSTPTRMALVALIVATMASGTALIYDYITNKTVALAAEKNRLWFGIAHVIFALLTLVYFLMLAMD
jgi:multidrug transporter EmrE-like cation transporter